MVDQHQHLLEHSYGLQVHNESNRNDFRHQNEVADKQVNGFVAFYSRVMLKIYPILKILRF